MKKSCKESCLGLAVVLVVVCFSLTGCSTSQVVRPDGSYASDHWGMFSGPDDAINAAIADEIRAEAAKKRAEAKAINEGRILPVAPSWVAPSPAQPEKKYRVKVINTSPEKAIRVWVTSPGQPGNPELIPNKGRGAVFLSPTSSFTVVVRSIKGNLLQIVTRDTGNCIPDIDGECYDAIVEVTGRGFGR